MNCLHVSRGFFIFLLLSTFSIGLFSAYASSNDSPPQNSGRTFYDYVDTGKTIGAQTGTIYTLVARDLFNASAVPEYPSITDQLEALHLGKIDAALVAAGYIIPLIDSGAYPDFEYLPVDTDFYEETAAPMFETTELRDKYNAWLAGAMSDGTYDEMINRWIDVPLPAEEDIPRFKFSGENGTLRVSDSGDYPPFTYLDSNGEPVGFNQEMVGLFAGYLGMDVHTEIMSYDGIIPYVLSGRADMSACLFTITEERAESVIFGDPTMFMPCALVVRKDETAVAIQQQTFITHRFYDWLTTAIERNLITDNRWKLIVNGLGTTMIITFAAQILGAVFGCFVCFVITRKNRFVKKLGELYCGLIRGTPVVVLLMITYYIIFGSVKISNVVVAIAAFTLVVSASIAQLLQGAIDTVDTVEIEAARSIGFPAYRAFTAITLPQTVRRAMPGYTNGFVELMKATAIVGYIAIQDLTRAADIIRSRTYDPYFPLLLVAAIYLIITTICIQVFKKIVRKYQADGCAMRVPT